MSPGNLRALTSTCVLLGVLGTFALATSAAEARTSLGVTKTLRASSGAKSVLIYRIQATNRGATAARAVKLTTAIPPATRFSSASPGCAPSGAHAVTCSLGTIRAHGKVTVTIVLVPTRAGGAPTTGLGVGTVPSAPTLPSFAGLTTLTSPDAPAAVVRAPFVLPACTRTITGTETGTIVVEPGETVCIVNATVRGAVIVDGGGGLSISNSEIIGSVIARGATFVSICGPTAGPYVPTAETVVGSVSISDTTGPVTIGSPAGCAPNVIGGSLTLRANRGGTTVFGNTIGGGTGATSNLNGLLIGANTITASLTCRSNVPPPTNGGTANNVGGVETGQCAGL